MKDKHEFRFGDKKTEAEWLASSDRFWLAFTPKVFEWLGWVALLAAVTYVQKKSGSVALQIFLSACTVSMMFYFFAFFAHITFTGFLENHPRLQRSASIFISSCLAGGAYYMASESVNVIATYNP